MLRKRLTYANVMSTLALFFALAGGSAVALTGSNTVFNDDIVNDEVTTADVRNDNLAFGGLYQEDLGPNSVASSEVANNSLGSADVIEESMLFNNTLNADDIATAAVGSAEVANDSLTGTDINESTLVGVKDGCHSGATLFGRICAAGGGSTGTVYQALNTWSPIGMRLPTWSEAITLAANHDVPGVVAPPERFWTDEVTTAENAGGPFHVMVVDENGIGTDHADFAVNKIVCVETPNNL